MGSHPVSLKDVAVPSGRLYVSRGKYYNFLSVIDFLARNNCVVIIQLKIGKGIFISGILLLGVCFSPSDRHLIG